MAVERLQFTKVQLGSAVVKFRLNCEHKFLQGPSSQSLAFEPQAVILTKGGSPYDLAYAVPDGFIWGMWFKFRDQYLSLLRGTSMYLTSFSVTFYFMWSMGPTRLAILAIFLVALVIMKVTYLVSSRSFSADIFCRYGARLPLSS